MRIDTSGNVGIGTSSPAGLLNIKGSNGQLIIQNGTTAGGMRLSSYNNALNANGYMIFEGYSSEYGRFDSSGALLIGATSASSTPKLFVSANSSNNNAIVVQDTGTAYNTNQWFQVFLNSSAAVAGSIAHTAVTTTAYQTSSDARLKENIKAAELGLNKVAQIKVRSFDWKEDSSHTNYGFVAQELYEVFPEAVGKGSDGDLIENGKGTWQVEYGRLTPLLVAAIQELKAEIDALKGLK